MKIGFQLKGNVRKKLDSGKESNEEENKVEIIKSISENKIIPVVEKKIEAAPLVIPLIPPKKNVNSEAEAKIDSENSYIKSEPDDGLKPPKTADELAAEQIISELNNKASVRNEGPQLVIAQAEALSSKSKKGQPLLLANQAPELLGLSDDNERFKVDINLRADDVDFKSDIYKAIPIEKFGEAMLRGMGWAGPEEEEKTMADKLYKDVLPREQRLGLGAMPKPPEKSMKGSKEKKAKLKEEWNKKSLEKLSKQQLNDGDVVLVLEKIYAGRRAVILNTRGVPGLDKIRVCLESDGVTIEIKRTDAMLITKEELDSQPFSYQAMQEKEQLQKLKDIEDKKIEDEKEKMAKYKRDREKIVAEETEKFKKDSHKKSKKDEDRQRHHYTSDTKASSSSDKPTWIRSGIRVKLITKKYDEKYYLMKSTIIDVYDKNLASIKLDNGKILEDIKEKYLETVLPSIGGQCLILLGEFKGMRATLLERKKETEEVVVQLLEDLEVHVLSADYVAATA